MLPELRVGPIQEARTSRAANKPAQRTAREQARPENLYEVCK